MTNKKLNMEFDANNIHEAKIAERISQLEKEVEVKRAELKNGISKEIFREINDKNNEIADLKIKLSYERELKRQVWSRYSDKMTEKDFIRLWNERLRDDAIIADAERKENAVNLSRHQIYKTW